MKKYNFQEIEKRWQKKWEEEGIYTADDKSKKEKKYVLIEFPYPSGEGLHMGHLRPYVAGDVYGRHLRMRGHEVMYPIGWDAFGLPAENYAIKNKIQPAVSTAKNIKNAKQQLKSWGMGFDWSREINTTDPAYYKWTQWIFLQFWKAGLAYEATGLINWCPRDKTGLANEEVINGCCERCGALVEKKEMRQWYLKITAYAEKLLQGLKTLAWPEPIKIQQENWIGRSEGAELDFEVKTKEKPNFVLLHGWHGSPEKYFFGKLKSQLQKRGYKVEAPSLPHPGEPVVAKQVETALEDCAFDENTIVLGHSIGGVVAMKLIEKLKKPIRRLILVGSYIENRFKDNSEFEPETFDWKFDFEKIKNNTKDILILHDTKDPLVYDDQPEKIQSKLGGTILRFVAEEGHMRGANEPFITDVALPKIKVFTTRPDTLFGATYVVLSPEHPLITSHKSHITNYKEVESYIEKAKKKSDEERVAEGKDPSTGSGQVKTGVELKGVKAINPTNGEEIPVWIADYVLAGYGTGAIMAVPAHDERDFEFAKRYKLPVIKVISPVLVGHPEGVGVSQGAASNVISVEGDLWEGEGELVNSGKFTGMDSEKAKWEITKLVGGRKQVQYRLRDWVFSRQRYWGEPIPLIHCAKCGIVPVPDEELPVTLPDVKKYEPTGTGESPLAVIDSWVNVKCPTRLPDGQECGGPAKRETNTMPQWAGSSWYYLRYTDPKNDKEFAGKKPLEHWLPVDVYFGGMEHTTLHLLYSRFWHQFLYDKKLVPTQEPYARRIPHGIILGPDGEKMSKSRGNVVNPDEIVKNFGADCLRMYELFLGPHEATVSWKSEGILGVSRFLERVWALAHRVKDDETKNGWKTRELIIHRAIKKVGSDIENMSFNTAVSQMMITLRVLENYPEKKSFAIFLKLLAPFAPHLAEELWQCVLGNKTSIHKEAWPQYDENLIKKEAFTLVIQVNGKVRDSVEVPAGISESAAKELALGRDKIKNILGANNPKRVIYVSGKLISIVL